MIFRCPRRLPSHLLAVVCVAATLGIGLAQGCAGANTQTYVFATLEEARRSGAVEKGWVPEGLPPGTHDIRVAQLPGSSRHWGIVNFPRPEADGLKRLLQPDPVSLSGEHCDMPGRIEWWPGLLRGTLDDRQLAATGIQGYRARTGHLLFAVNWSQGRAYYWEAVEK